MEPAWYRSEPMTLALDAEYQTPEASPDPPCSPERAGEQYILGYTRLGGSAGGRQGVPATRAGQSGAYAVASRFRRQGYQVVRARHDTLPLILLAFSSEELVLVLIRRTRQVPSSLHAIADLYQEEILTLRDIPNPKGAHCSYQFWLSIPCHGWRVFEVMKGGIREITRDI